MINKLKNLFQNTDNKEENNEQELKLAAATLMFELIKSDGQIDQIELSHMRTILRSEFELDEDDVDELFVFAKQSAQDAISLHAFTRKICDNWDNSKRMKLLEYLWVLALADENIDPHERHLVRKVAGLLYLNESQIVKSRENAKRQLDISKHK